MRGLAALSVVLRHLLNVFPRDTYPLADLLVKAPTRILFAGHEAVLLFFLLSGFVLAASILSSRLDYPAFLRRRLCRIYPPYAAAVGLAALGAICFGGPRDGVSTWFAMTWNEPVTPAMLSEQLLLVGRFDTAQLNTAFWSLVYEMRISLIFPLLLLFTVHAPAWAVAVAAAGATTAAAGTSPYEADWLPTLHYAGIFAAGAVMVRTLDSLQAAYEAIGGRSRAILSLAALALVLYGYGPPSVRAHFGFFTDWFVVAGDAWLIMAALSSRRFGSALRLPAIQYLGRVSYSLYLVHATVLFSLVHLLPLWGAALLYLPLTFGVTAIFHRLVEAPSIQLSKQAWRRAAKAEA
nr:acyltransferase [Azospirillum picis]